MPSTRSSGRAFEAGSLNQHPHQWAVSAGDEPDADDHALVVADVEAVTTGEAFSEAVESAARSARMIAAGQASPYDLVRFVKTMASFAPAIATEGFVDEHLANQHENLLAVVHTAIQQQNVDTAGFVGESQRVFAGQFQQECQNFGALICAEVDRKLSQHNGALVETAGEWKEQCRQELAAAMEQVAHYNNEAALVLQGVREEASQANARTANHFSELLVARTNSLTQVFNNAIAEVRSSTDALVTTKLAAQKADLDGSLRQMTALVHQQTSTFDTMADTAAVRRATEVFERLTQTTQATFEASQAHSHALVEASQATQRNETNAIVLGARGEIAQEAAVQNAATLQRMTENIGRVTAIFNERMQAQTQEFQARQESEMTMAAAKAAVARTTDRIETRAYVTQASANVFSKSIETSSASLQQTANAHQSAMDELAEQLRSAQAQLEIITTSVKVLERQVERVVRDRGVDLHAVNKAVKQAGESEAKVSGLERDITALQRAAKTAASGVATADNAMAVRLRNIEKSVHDLIDEVQDQRIAIDGYVNSIEKRSPGSTPTVQRTARAPDPAPMRQPAFEPNDIEVRADPPRGRNEWPANFGATATSDNAPPPPRRHADPAGEQPDRQGAHAGERHASAPLPTTRARTDGRPRSHHPDDSSTSSDDSSSDFSFESMATSAAARKLNRKLGKSSGPVGDKMGRIIAQCVDQRMADALQQRQQQQPVVQTIVVDNGAFANSDALSLNKIHSQYPVTYAKHLAREHLTETSGDLTNHRVMTDDVRSDVVVRLHVAADILPTSAMYLQELVLVLKHHFGSNDGIESYELDELVEAYDTFVRERRSALDRTPTRDQVLCLTQSTAKFPAFYPDYDKAVTVFNALRTLRRRITAVVCSVTKSADVRHALTEANHNDTVCKRVIELKVGFDFIAIAKAKLRGRGRAPAAAGAGAQPATPADSKGAQRRRRRDERDTAAKQPQASTAAPANASAEARGTAAPAGPAPSAAPARNNGAPAGAAAGGRH
jgi:hypothetical protein